VLPAQVEQKLKQLLDHLMYITRPDGTTPFFGDDDGGRLVMLDQRPANDFRAALSTGAYFSSEPTISMLLVMLRKRHSGCWALRILLTMIVWLLACQKRSQSVSGRWLLHHARRLGDGRELYAHGLRPTRHK
jgi:hypothetical protein